MNDELIKNEALEVWYSWGNVEKEIAICLAKKLLEKHF